MAIYEAARTGRDGDPLYLIRRPSRPTRRPLPCTIVPGPTGPGREPPGMRGCRALSVNFQLSSISQLPARARAGELEPLRCWRLTPQARHATVPSEQPPEASKNLVGPADRVVVTGTMVRGTVVRSWELLVSSASDSPRAPAGTPPISAPLSLPEAPTHPYTRITPGPSVITSSASVAHEVEHVKHVVREVQLSGAVGLEVELVPEQLLLPVPLPVALHEHRIAVERKAGPLR